LFLDGYFAGGAECITVEASFTDGLVTVPMNMIGIGTAKEAGGHGCTLAMRVLNVFAAFTDIGVDAMSHIQQGYFTDSAVV